MSSRFARALKLDLKSKDTNSVISPPKWMNEKQLCYEVIMGSNAYGVAVDSSDEDIYGFAMPPKGVLFSHLDGHIEGFGTQKQNFEQFQLHHVEDNEARKEYDFSIYNIVKYFELCRQNNPNMIDSLFVSQECITHITAIGQMVRDNRRLFLSKACYAKLRGYAYSQLHKMDNKNPVGKRKGLVELHGYDSKFLYHIFRLTCEAEQILTTGDLDLKRDRELLKSVRRGDWKEEDARKWFVDKEKQLDILFANSKLQEVAPEEKLRKLLLECIEHHYGKISKEVLTKVDSYDILKKINELSGRILYANL